MEYLWYVVPVKMNYYLIHEQSAELNLTQPKYSQLALDEDIVSDLCLVFCHVFAIYRDLSLQNCFFFHSSSSTGSSS
jgi:hypothetical protein